MRYLTEAKKVFGRDDLAVVSYHMGIGNLSDVVRAYTAREAIRSTHRREADIDYARLYFDSSPIGSSSGLGTARLVRRRLADVLLASSRRTRNHASPRNDPGRLERLAELHDRLPSAGLVLHPPDCRASATPMPHSSRTPSHVACSFPFGRATERISRSIRNS